MFKTTFYELKSFFILWITQSFSSLGSAMTNFALIIWLYQKSGSALTTSMLSICSYAPYVLMSIFDKLPYAKPTFWKLVLLVRLVIDGIKKPQCYLVIVWLLFVQ